MKTNIITLPIEKREWKNVPAITKTGKVSKTRTEWKLVKVADEQDFQGYIITINGKDVEVFAPTASMSDTHHTICNLFTKDGKLIMATWRHGRYGSMVHEEPALFDYKREEFVTVTTYCDGRFKDSYKYLIKVCI